MIHGEYWWVYADSGQVDWSRWVGGEKVPVSEGSVDDCDRVPAPGGASVVLVIPGAAVRIHNVNAPSRNRRRFLSSLPYVLEDRLLHTPEDYHFVPLSRDRGSSLPVAVINRQELEKLLHTARQKGWTAVYAFVDYHCIGQPPEGTWKLDATGFPMLLRCDDKATGAALAETVTHKLPGSLILAMEQATRKPGKLEVRVSDQQSLEKVRGWSKDTQTGLPTIEVIKADKSRAQLLSRTGLPPAELSLLAGGYEQVNRGRKKLQGFRAVVGLAAALLLVWIIHWFVQGVQLRAEYETGQVALEETYRSVFPDARNIVDPRYQMEQELIRLRTARQPGNSSETGFLEMLDRIAAVISSEGYEVTRLEYDGDRIILDLSIPDYESLERLQQRLAGNLDVTVVNAELVEGRVNSRISLGTSI